MEYNLDVSIIICAYTMDRWKDTCEAVESAQAQEPRVREIILVIDHNPELSARAKAKFPDVMVIKNGQAQGLSGGRNSGIATAGGKYVAFLDDDAIADKHWADHLVAQLQQPNVVGANGKINPLWLGQRPSWFPDEFLWTVGCSWRGLPNEVAEIRNISGAGCCLRRDLFDAVGGFNLQLGRKKEKTPISCEETELCIRARQILKSAQFILEPAAVIQHKVPAQRLTWSYFALRCYAEGRSKAYLARLVGTDHGLSSERSYVWRTLSSGFFNGLADGVLRLDPGGFGRAAAISCGLICAIAGYLTGKISFGSKNSVKPAASPSELIDLSETLGKSSAKTAR